LRRTQSSKKIISKKLKTMKETRELLTFAAQGINAGYTIAADGKVDFADLGALVPLVLAGQEGIGGVKLIGS